MPRVVALILIVALAACETTNSSDWNGGGGTPFKQAERSCQDLMGTIAKEDARREFFVVCMRAFGWTPKPGASIDL